MRSPECFSIYEQILLLLVVRKTCSEGQIVEPISTKFCRYLRNFAHSNCIVSDMVNFRAIREICLTMTTICRLCMVQLRSHMHHLGVDNFRLSTKRKIFSKFATSERSHFFHFSDKKCTSSLSRVYYTRNSNKICRNNQRYR